MRYLILIILLPLIGCGVRKVDKSKSVDKTIELKETDIRERISFFLNENTLSIYKDSYAELKSDSLVSENGKVTIFNPTLNISKTDSVSLRSQNKAVLKDSIYSDSIIIGKDIKVEEKQSKRDGTDIVIVLGIMFFLYLVIFSKK